MGHSPAILPPPLSQIRNLGKWQNKPIFLFSFRYDSFIIFIIFSLKSLFSFASLVQVIAMPRWYVFKIYKWLDTYVCRYGKKKYKLIKYNCKI